MSCVGGGRCKAVLCLLLTWCDWRLIEGAHHLRSVLLQAYQYRCRRTDATYISILIKQCYVGCENQLSDTPDSQS